MFFKIPFPNPFQFPVARFTIDFPEGLAKKGMIRGEKELGSTSIVFQAQGRAKIKFGDFEGGRNKPEEN